MTRILHHIPEETIRDWACGRLPQPFGVLIAAHLSLCDECRALAEAEDLLAGLTLERLPGVQMSDAARERLMAALDEPPPPPRPRACGIFPAPVMEALDGGPPQWRRLGGGVRQHILSTEGRSSLRLLYIPPGRAVPEHGPGGREMTLVLQGSFSDSAGVFRRGDVECAHDEVNHQPVAGLGEPCVCLAATDAPLRFRAMLPRLLQPLFRI